MNRRNFFKNVIFGALGGWLGFKVKKPGKSTVSDHKEVLTLEKLREIKKQLDADKEESYKRGVEAIAFFKHGVFDKISFATTTFVGDKKYYWDENGKFLGYNTIQLYKGI